MPNGHNFEHLPLVLCSTGPALIRGGGKQSPQTKANQLARAAHTVILATASSQLSADWKARVAQRQEQHLPVLAGGMPLLLQVDTGLDLDVLRKKFSFEIVAEQEDGYVIVASEDIDLTAFQTMVKGFAVQIHGSATIASVHRLFDDPDQDGRLWRILSEPLYAIWPTISDDTQYIVDFGIACTGTREIPKPPKRGKRDTDAKWAAKESEWSTARHAAYIEWDEIKISRETAVEQFVVAYQGEILRTLDGALDGAAVLPDSFTVRLKIVGRGLKDFVLNYPYIFEVVEPDDISLPQHSGQTADQGLTGSARTPLPF